MSDQSVPIERTDIQDLFAFEDMKRLGYPDVKEYWQVGQWNITIKMWGDSDTDFCVFVKGADPDLLQARLKAKRMRLPGLLDRLTLRLSENN